MNWLPDDPNEFPEELAGKYSAELGS